MHCKYVSHIYWCVYSSVYWLSPFSCRHSGIAPGQIYFFNCIMCFLGEGVGYLHIARAILFMNSRGLVRLDIAWATYWFLVEVFQAELYHIDISCSNTSFANISNIFIGRFIGWRRPAANRLSNDIWPELSPQLYNIICRWGGRLSEFWCGFYVLQIHRHRQAFQLWQLSFESVRVHPANICNIIIPAEMDTSQICQHFLFTVLFTDFGTP